jgi:hypothetical protein
LKQFWNNFDDDHFFSEKKTKTTRGNILIYLFELSVYLFGSITRIWYVCEIVLTSSSFTSFAKFIRNCLICDNRFTSSLRKVVIISYRCFNIWWYLNVTFLLYSSNKSLRKKIYILLECNFWNFLGNLEFFFLTSFKRISHGKAHLSCFKCICLFITYLFYLFIYYF